MRGSGAGETFSSKKIFLQRESRILCKALTGEQK
jgi:hypothetical protein